MKLYVLFNHLFLSVDPVTYQAISDSEFLRSEFAVSETRTTFRNDYPEGYTGVYFYGHETYFEFFDAGKGAFPLGSLGIASGYETKGHIAKAEKKLAEIGTTYSHDVNRMVDDKPITWFTSLKGNAETGFGRAQVWAMEYKDSFIKNWLGYSSELDGSILQSDFLQSYALKLDQMPLRKTALMKDITKIEASIEKQHFASYSAQFTGLGWQTSKMGECDVHKSRNTTVILCPAQDGDLPGIYKIEFSLTREYTGPREMLFGNSSLRFNGKSAEWSFYHNQ